MASRGTASFQMRPELGYSSLTLPPVAASTAVTVIKKQVLHGFAVGSRLRACEEIEIAGFGNTPQRHSREGGNPFQPMEQDLRWDPACAGTTLRPEFQAFQPVRRFFHTLLRGDDAAAAIASIPTAVSRITLWRRPKRLQSRPSVRSPRFPPPRSQARPGGSRPCARPAAASAPPPRGCPTS